MKKSSRTMPIKIGSKKETQRATGVHALGVRTDQLLRDEYMAIKKKDEVSRDETSGVVCV
jgi:hypothetical protein